MNDLIAVRRDNRFSQIPHWVNESKISDGAYRLYSYLFKYSDNTTREAYPSRATLAKDIRKTDRSVDTYIKELEAIGAVRVLRRKKRGTKQNYTNIYHVITANPYAEAELEAFAPEQDWEVIPEVAKLVSPGGEADFAGTNTHLTMTHSSFTSDESDDKNTCTSEVPSDAAMIPDRLKDAPNTPNPEKPDTGKPMDKRTHAGLTDAQRKPLRQAIQRVGQLRKQGYDTYSGPVQDAWLDFQGLMEETFPDAYYDVHEGFLELKVTVSAKEAEPLAAGKKLIKLINTANQQ